MQYGLRNTAASKTHLMAVRLRRHAAHAAGPTEVNTVSRTTNSPRTHRSRHRRVCGAWPAPPAAHLGTDIGGIDSLWDLLRTGRLNRKGMWHTLVPEDRHAWLSVALWSRVYRHRGKPDAPAGRTFTLEGRQVVDEDSFCCALGEAVNGPGGYFGWNLSALDDCLRGGWGAAPPFTVDWQHAAEARARLAEPVPTGEGETTTLFDLLLEILEEHGVQVILR